MFMPTLSTTDPWRAYTNADQLLRMAMARPRTAARPPWPPVTVEHNGAVTVRALVPGLSREDLQITATEDSITIQGERKHPEGYELRRQERPVGSFERTFTFRDPIDPDRISASVKDGILVVTVPHAEKSQPRRITIEG